MKHSLPRRTLCSALLVLLLSVAPAPAARKAVEALRPIAPPEAGPKIVLPGALTRSDPASPEDLQAIEKHVRKLLPKLMKATVGVIAGRAQGSGVIISEDGYVLTAGHVSATSGRNVFLILPNGKRLRGRTLGANHNADAGLIKITEKGKWPWVPIGDMHDVKTGNWCIATGHPGGYKPGRPPVVRLGRVIRTLRNTIQTDAVLVGGDSGGPLFDMYGRVIGINSRIGTDVTLNLHVSVDAFSDRDNWIGLARGRVWGTRRQRRPAAILGVSGTAAEDGKGFRVTEAPSQFPAAKAGIQVGDVITKLNGKPVKTLDDLRTVIRPLRPGNRVTVELLRGGKTLTFTLRLARG